MNNIFTIKRQMYMWYCNNSVWISNQIESNHIHHSELEYQQRKGENRPFFFPHLRLSKGEGRKGKQLRSKN